MEKPKSIFKKIDTKLNTRKIPWIVAGAMAVVILLLIIWFFSSSKDFKPGEATFRYCMGNKLTYSEDMKLVHTEKSTTIEDADSVTSDGTPIIYENQQKMVTPVSMGYMRPFEEDGLNRVNYFATLTYEGGVVKILHNGITTEAKTGFLYDGDGTYIFLDNMKITVGSSTYKVSPLSYAKEIYKNCVEIYDTATGEYQYIALTDVDAVAESSTGYQINLGTGVMTVGGDQRILFADIEAMGALK